MVARMAQVMGVIVAIALLVAALWAWGHASSIAENTRKPALAAWAVRSGSVAAVAGAQVLLITFVVGTFYRQRARNAFDDGTRLFAGLVCTIALISAIALMLAGR